MRLSRLSLLAIMLLPGCATVVDGVTQTVTIRTAPEGAACRVDRANEVIGEIPSTPGSIELVRGRHDLTVFCQKPGWEPVVAAFPAKYTGATFGNLLIGGGVGFIVDASTGASFRYDEDRMILLTPRVGAGSGRAVANLGRPAS